MAEPIDSANRAYARWLISGVRRKMDNVTELVGCKASEPAVASFVSALGTQVRTDMFGGLRIRDYPAQGISLYFDEADVLVTAFLFDAGVEEHSRYEGVLPHVVGNVTAL